MVRVQIFAGIDPSNFLILSSNYQRTTTFPRDFIHFMNVDTSFKQILGVSFISTSEIPHNRLEICVSASTAKLSITIQIWNFYSFNVVARHGQRQLKNTQSINSGLLYSKLIDSRFFNSTNTSVGQITLTLKNKFRCRADFFEFQSQILHGAYLSRKPLYIGLWVLKF